MSKGQELEAKSTVYGPVKSWRFGQSLGIDPIYHVSTCSFNCIYCQLGSIVQVTRSYKSYVPTKQVLDDFKHALKENARVDVITYSGSGEPSLAANLKEIILGIRQLAPQIPQYILTNGTEMGREEVQEALSNLDKVIVKLDSPDEKMFQMFNRPAPGITVKTIVENILSFKKKFTTDLEIQSMFMPMNLQKDLQEMAQIFKAIAPSAIQLNTPKRAYPLTWLRENRGNHSGVYHCETRELKNISKEEALFIEQELRRLTGLNIFSVYR